MSKNMEKPRNDTGEKAFYPPGFRTEGDKLAERSSAEAFAELFRQQRLKERAEAMRQLTEAIKNATTLRDIGEYTQEQETADG